MPPINGLIQTFIYDTGNLILHCPHIPSVEVDVNHVNWCRAWVAVSIDSQYPCLASHDLVWVRAFWECFGKIACIILT